MIKSSCSYRYSYALAFFYKIGNPNFQAVLGGINFNEYRHSESTPALDALAAFRHLSRITRAIVEVAIVKKLGSQLKSGLKLMRCISAKAWEDRPIVMRQVEHLGSKSIKTLAQHGITSLDLLGKADPRRLEMASSKGC